MLTRANTCSGHKGFRAIFQINTENSDAGGGQQRYTQLAEMARAAENPNIHSDQIENAG